MKEGTEEPMEETPSVMNVSRKARESSAPRQKLNDMLERDLRKFEELKKNRNY